MGDQPLSRMSKMEIQQEIRNPIHNVVKKYPLQTYVSIARTMQLEEDPYVKRHPQSEKTMTRYIRPVMETDFAVKE